MKSETVMPRSIWGSIPEKMCNNLRDWKKKRGRERASETKRQDILDVR